MSYLVPPLRFNAVEYRKPLDGGITKPRLIVAIDDNNQTKEVVLKLKFPTTSVGPREGHYAGTSLACELICAALARAIGLNVPDYAIVNIAPGFANSIHETSARNLIMNNIGLNFGTEYHESFALWDPISYKPSPAAIDQLEDILSFDSIVINGDRQFSKPNLLYRGDEFLLIDHSLALPVHFWDQQTFASLPHILKEIIEDHCVKRHLRRRSSSYSRVFDIWQERINSQALEELRAMLPESWEHKPGDIDRIFMFLHGRNRHFSDMSNSLMEVLS